MVGLQRRLQSTNVLKRYNIESCLFAKLNTNYGMLAAVANGCPQKHYIVRISMGKETKKDNRRNEWTM